MSVGPWVVLDERPLVKTKWLDAWVERCRTPSGAVVDDYTVLHYPDWSVAVPLTTDGRLVMTRQWREGAQVLSLECPGGVVDAGETPERAAARELIEETGYRGRQADRLLSVRPNPASQRNWFHATVFTDCERVAEPRDDATEVLDLALMTAQEVLAAIRSGELVHGLQVAVLLSLFIDRPGLLKP
jgi:ADP-ribose pyrophosphatase YjhB (NUDIX family)